MNGTLSYTRLRKGEIARTIEAGDAAMADVDDQGRILGVETLDGQDWRNVLVTLAMTGRLTIPREAAA